MIMHHILTGGRSGTHHDIDIVGIGRRLYGWDESERNLEQVKRQAPGHVLHHLVVIPWDNQHMSRVHRLNVEKRHRDGVFIADRDLRRSVDEITEDAVGG